jgi:hypothetical protein
MNTWFAFAPSSDATRATKDPGANLAFLSPLTFRQR